MCIKNIQTQLCIELIHKRQFGWAWMPRLRQLETIYTFEKATCLQSCFGCPWNPQSSEHRRSTCMAQVDMDSFDRLLELSRQCLPLPVLFLLPPLNSFIRISNLIGCFTQKLPIENHIQLPTLLNQRPDLGRRGELVPLFPMRCQDTILSQKQVGPAQRNFCWSCVWLRLLHPLGGSGSQNQLDFGWRWFLCQPFTANTIGQGQLNPIARWHFNQLLQRLLQKGQWLCFPANHPKTSLQLPGSFSVPFQRTWTFHFLGRTGIIGGSVVRQGLTELFGRRWQDLSRFTYPALLKPGFPNGHRRCLNPELSQARPRSIHPRAVGLIVVVPLTFMNILITVSKLHNGIASVQDPVIVNGQIRHGPDGSEQLSSRNHVHTCQTQTIKLPVICLNWHAIVAVLHWKCKIWILIIVMKNTMTTGCSIVYLHRFEDPIANGSAQGLWIMGSLLGSPAMLIAALNALMTAPSALTFLSQGVQDRLRVGEPVGCLLNRLLVATIYQTIPALMTDHKLGTANPHELFQQTFPNPCQRPC